MPPARSRPVKRKRGNRERRAWHLYCIFIVDKLGRGPGGAAPLHSVWPQTHTGSWCSGLQQLQRSHTGGPSLWGTPAHSGTHTFPWTLKNEGGKGESSICPSIRPSMSLTLTDAPGPAVPAGDLGWQAAVLGAGQGQRSAQALQRSHLAEFQQTGLAGSQPDAQLHRGPAATSSSNKLQRSFDWMERSWSGVIYGHWKGFKHTQPLFPAVSQS